MPRPYSPYVPQTVGELWDLLGSMALGNPTFIDRTGYFPEKNIETTFFALTEGLKAIRKKLGDERYERLIDMADRMRTHFESDPEDAGEGAAAGRTLLWEMEDVIDEVRRRKPLIAADDAAPE